MNKTTRDFIGMSFLLTFRSRNDTGPGHNVPALLKFQTAILLWLPVESAHSLLPANACAYAPTALILPTGTAGC
jgi:uncharacterized membrane-anchored protein